MRLAGWPRSPRGPTAVTLRLCFPGLTLTTNGDAQGLSRLWSSLQRNVEPGSLARNMKLAFLLVVSLFGPYVIIVRVTGLAPDPITSIAV